MEVEMNILEEITKLDELLFLIARLRREAESRGEPDMVEELEGQWREADWRRQEVRSTFTISEDCLYEMISSPARGGKQSA